jgi:hypothetical protein
MASPGAARRSIVAFALAGLTSGLASPAALIKAADVVPTAVDFLRIPNDVYIGRPFDVLVGIVAFQESQEVVVTTGTSATVTVGFATSPVPDATLACTSGLSLQTETSGPGAGTVKFSGCTIDRTGEGYVLSAVASAIASTTVPTPALAPANSAHLGFIRVGAAIEAPQPSIAITLTHDGTSPYFTWGQTVTVRIAFSVNGANKPFQLQQTTREMTTWSPVADLTTNATGVATYVFRPSVSTRFRVVFMGSPDLPAGTSDSRGFLLYALAKQVPTHASPKVIRRGTVVAFATTVRPILPELEPARVTFLISHRVSGAWKLVSWRYVAVDASGVARLSLKFGGAGEWYVRSSAGARWIGDPETAPAVSWASRPTPIARYSVR